MAIVEREESQDGSPATAVASPPAPAPPAIPTPPATSVSPGAQKVPATLASTTTVECVAEARLFNAQLSELEWIRRVLEEARDEEQPLLERMKLLAITYAKLDEFFEIHVSGLRELREGVQAGTSGLLPDGRTATEALAAVEERLRPLVAEQDAYWQQVRGELAASGIFLLSMEELDEGQRAAAGEYYERHVHAVLTPLAIDPAHKFPFISHLSVNLAVELNDPDAGRQFARLKVPGNLPRLVAVPPPESASAGAPPEGGHTPSYFVWLESLIAAHLERLFPGVPVVSSYQ
ncbi:MAG: hypothetical protein ACRDI2_11180, partial [Chloroflexota bacterium]